MSRKTRKSNGKNRWKIPAIIAGALLIAAGGFFAVKNLTGRGIASNETTVETYSVDEIAYGDSGAGLAASGSVTKSIKVSVVASPATGAKTITNSTYVASGGELRLEATENSGYTFVGWYEGDSLLSTFNPCTITNITANRAITAKFKITSYTVTTAAVIGKDKKDSAGIDGYNYYISGGGSVSGGGILNATSTDTIELTAIPADGFKFSGWIVDNLWNEELSCPTPVNPIILTTQTVDAVDQDKKIQITDDTVVKAVFEKTKGTITVSIVPAAGLVDITTGSGGASRPTDSWSHGQTSVASGGQYTLWASTPVPTEYIDFTDSSGKPARQDRYSLGRLYRIKEDGSKSEETHWENNYDQYTNAIRSGDWSIDTDTDKDYNYVFELDAYNASDNAGYAAIGNVYPAGAGTVTGGGSSTLAATYTLNANPAEGYVFDHWEWGSAGTTYTSTDNPLNAYPKGFEYYTAYFVKKKVNISVTSINPAETMEIISGTGDAVVDSATGKASVSIKCKPLDGYKISKWSTTANSVTTDHGDSVTSDGGYTLLNFTASDDTTVSVTLTQTAYRISASADPGGTGNIVTMSGNGDPSGDVSTSDTVASISKLVSENESITLTATAGDGYTFKQWVGSDGAIDNTGTTKIITVSKDISYVAQFEKKEYTIGFEVDSANPNGTVSLEVDGGSTYTSSPQQIAAGSTVKITATPSANHVFDYWTNKAGEKIKDNPITINGLNYDDTFTAHFADAKNTVRVKVAPAGAGTVTSGSTSGTDITIPEIEYNGSLSISATANSEYTFERWEDDNGNIYTSNPLQIVNITKDMNFTAVFNTKESGITVLASPASGGKVTKTISADGKSAELKAVANSGYKFVNWKKGSTVISNTATCTVTDMTDGTVYTAYFSGGSLDSVEDAKSSITNQSYYNDKRKTTSPNYSVTRDKLASSAANMITVEKATQYADSTPAQKNYRAVANAEGLYDDIEIGDDRSAVTNDSELVTSDGNIIPVTYVSSYSAEEELAKKYVEEKFGEYYRGEILTCKKVTLPGDFGEGTHTFIWKNQNVYDKDNIFIIYENPMSDPDWVSCVVDEGKSIRFTIDSVQNGCIMTIVKVIIQ